MSITIPPVILPPPYDAACFVAAVQASVREMFGRDRNIRALTYLSVLDHPDTGDPLEAPIVVALAAESSSTTEDRHLCACAAHQLSGRLRTRGLASATEAWGLPLIEGYRLSHEDLSKRRDAERLVTIMVEHREYEGIVKGWRATIRPGRRALGPWLQLPALLVAPGSLVLSNPSLSL